MKKVAVFLMVLFGMSVAARAQLPPPAVQMYVNIGGVPTAVTSSLTSGQLTVPPPAMLAKCMNGSLIVDCDFSGGGGGSCGTANIPCTNTTNTFTANQVITSAATTGAVLTLINTSSANSAYIDFQSVGGHEFILFNGSTAFGSPYFFVDDVTAGAIIMAWGGNNANLNTEGILGWTNSSNPASAADTGFSRISAQVVGLGDGGLRAHNGTLSLANIIISGTCAGCTPIEFNWTFNSGAAATDAAPRILAAHAGTIANCYVLTTASDGSTALTINIFKNGTSILGGAQTVAAGTAAGTITTLTSATAFASNDIESVNITSGTSSWIFSVQCK